MMRPMTMADVDAVVAIEQAVQAYPWTRGNFCDAINSGYLCYVEEEQSVLRGYAVLMPGVDEAELLTIAVSEDYQCKGLGAAMLASICAAGRGWQRVFLEVRASNLPAISLYHRAGFCEIGVRRGYYRNAQGSEDAQVMAFDAKAFGEING